MKALGTMMLSFDYFSTLALAGICLSASPCNAQGLYNGSNIYVNGTGVYVDGDIINSGRLENDGVVAFTRDWQSEGKYKGEGEVHANGNSAQKIHHYDQKVKALVAKGWGTKYIKGTLKVTGTLHLITGIVEVGVDDVLTLEDDAVAHGGSPASYVEGPLTVQGTGYKFFPLGKHGTYAPIEFLDVEGSDPEFSVEAFDDAPSLSVADVIIRQSLYWQRTDIKKGYGGSPVAVDFPRSFFAAPEKIMLLTGTDWQEPFTIISDLEFSAETDKVSTGKLVSAPIIMLGQMSERWEEADFYLPAALSANAARVENQNVKIFGDRLSDDGFRFQVFNRWGALVYESTSLENMKNQGWDGRSINGVQLISGTYPYRLNASDKTGSRFEKAGVITIVH